MKPQETPAPQKIYRLSDLPAILTDALALFPEFCDAASPRRLIHGRGNLFPGLEYLNIDIYPPLLLAAVYRTLEPHELPMLTGILEELFPDAPLLIQDRSIRPVRTLHDTRLPRELTVREAGLEYLIHPGRGQNPGFFPDMRIGRRLTAEITARFPGPCRVLNLFAYTCAFSIAALAAGASKTVNIDMNRNSLEIGRKNHRMNGSRFPGGYGSQALFLPHDIFKSWGKLKKEGPYGLIIADPPPSQRGSFLFAKDYSRIIRRLPEMLETGGSLLLTCNSGDTDWTEFETLVRENLEGIRELTRIDPPEDYRVKEAGRGLKILHCRLSGERPLVSG